VHVGLNLVFLVPGETGGMEIVARELIPALVEARSDLRLTAFVNLETAESRDAPWRELVRTVPVPVRARRRTEWVRGEQQLLPRLAARERVDLLHSLGSTAPAWGPFRRVVTVHDLIYRFYPETHGRVRALGMRLLVPLAVRRAHRVNVVSESTRDDLIRLLRVPPGKLDVVPSGVRPPAAAPTPEPELRARHGLAERELVLTVGAKRPHKNLGRLLEACALIPAGRRPLLVLVGYGVPAYERELQARARELGIERDVRLLGWATEADLEGLYAAARCFVLPSLYEGFGLPVLEAMDRGLPVACSNRSSLPELANGAALLFDPEDSRAIAGAMERLLTDSREADALREAGRRRVASFTWERTARLTVASYERSLTETR
jgi:glycosyltransferase involved in cell wall biosynthesis